MGKYTVKSGYHIVRNLLLSSSLSSLKDGWASSPNSDNIKIWRAALSNKINFFLWSAWLDSLPTWGNLYKRKVIKSLSYEATL